MEHTRKTITAITTTTTTHIVVPVHCRGGRHGLDGAHQEDIIALPDALEAVGGRQEDGHHWGVWRGGRIVIILMIK